MVKPAGLLAGCLGRFGRPSTVLGLSAGFLAAGLAAAALLASGHATRRTQLPLGPFLIVAALAATALA